MQKSGGLIALLLVVTLLLLPFKDISENSTKTVSSQTVCGDTVATEQTDSQDNTVKIVVIVVVVILIIWFITSISDTPSYGQEVKADWKLF